MAAPMPRVFLPVLCLLLASLCQWLAGPVRSDTATLGMVAPVPVSWESVKPGALLGSSVFGGANPMGVPAWEGTSATPNRLLQAVDRVTVSDRQERLLWWGRLLLEGG